MRPPIPKRARFLLLLILILLAAFLYEVHKRNRSEEKWSQLQKLTLYDIDAIREDDYLSRIGREQPLAVDQSLIPKLATNVKAGGGTLWKGSFLGKATFRDGSECHVAFSYIGDYFMVIEWGQTFYFTEPGARTFGALRKHAVGDVFVPARKQAAVRN